MRVLRQQLLDPLAAHSKRALVSTEICVMLLALAGTEEGWSRQTAAPLPVRVARGWQGDPADR